MKPLLLEMEGFGPYRNKTKIDFNDLPNNLTLITGNTGAGKTTIFDAICCALYGETSGKDRTFSQMRSEFIDDSLPTSVLFTFELKGQKYQIKRSPNYLRLKRNGDGTTRVAPKAELIMPDGSIITKTQTVNERIKEIIGIEKDEFRQIVMIAQNDFMAMIKGTDKKQEEIFNRIFNAHLYENFAKEILHLKNQSETEVNDLNQRIISSIMNADIEFNSQDINNDFINTKYLKSLIHNKKKTLDDECSKLFKSLKENQSELDKLKTRLQIEKSLLDNFQKRRKLKDELNKLDLKKDEINLLKKRKENASKARDYVLTHFNQFENVKKEVASLNTENRRNEDQLKKLKNEHLKIEKELSSYSKEALEQKRISYEKLKDELNEYRKLASLRNDLKKKEESRKDILEDLENITLEIVTLQEKKEEIIIHPESEYRNKEETLNFKLREKQNNKELLIQTDDLINKIREFLNELIQLENKVLAKKEIYENSRKVYNQSFDFYIENQASLLAQELRNGKPCPVCGSIDHPNPAKTHGPSISQDDLEFLKKKYQQNEANYQTCVENLKDIINTIKNLVNQLNKLENTLNEIFTNNDREALRILIEHFQKIIESTGLEKTLLSEIDKKYKKYQVSYINQLKLINTEIDEIKSEINQVSIDFKINQANQHRLKEIDESLDKLNKKSNEIEIALNESRDETVGIRATIKTIQEKLEFSDYQEALKICRELKNNYEDYNQNFTKIQNQNNEIIKQINRSLGKSKTISQNLETKKLELNVKQDIYLKQLVKANFVDESSFLESILNPEQLSLIENKIINYQNEKLKIKELYQQLNKELENSATRFQVKSLDTK